jgi:uncharacterized protein (DUF2345 family)
MATTAHKHNAVLKGEQGQAGPRPEQLPAIAQMAHGIAVLKGTAGGGNGNGGQDGAPGGQGQVTAYTEAQLQLSSPAGIAATTPADAIFAAGNTGSISAGQDVNFASQRNGLYAAKAGISLFTYGKADNADKPNQETGIRLHAASGKVSSKSQSDATRITADKAITLASISKSISIGAQDHILMTAQGAYLRLEGGNIDIHGPGKMEFLASMKELAGPVSVPNLATANKIHELNLKRDLEIEYVDAEGNPLKNEPIGLRFADNNKNVTLDGDGKARIKNVRLGPLRANQPKRK